MDTNDCDLSDPALLDKDEVIEVIKQCHGVTVPTEAMVPHVKPFQARVRMLPSLVNAQTFRGVQRVDFSGPLIACVEDHDWGLLAEPLKGVLRHFPTTFRVATDNDFLLDFLGDCACRFPRDLQAYPVLVRSACVALLPRDKPDRDTVWAHEFGIGGVVGIGLPAYRGTIEHQDTGLFATTSDHWGQYLTALLTEERVRKRLQVAAVAEARLRTTIQGSDSWLRTIG